MTKMPKLPDLGELRLALIRRLLPGEPTAENWQRLVKLVIPEERYEFYNPTRQVSYVGHQLIFNVPSGNTIWRVNHLLDAEPETLDWLSRLTPHDVLYDVGANVGMYSIIAAKVYSARVFSFEPESFNYATLNKNIMYNYASDLITAYCVAISDKAKFDHFYLTGCTAGGAMHSFGEAKHVPLDDSTELQSFVPAFRQGAVSVTIDELVARGLPLPTFIKIDVDGFEDQVIAGAADVLRKAERLNILVEANLNVPSHLGMLEFIESLGYRCLRRDTNCIYERP